MGPIDPTSTPRTPSPAPASSISWKVAGLIVAPMLLVLAVSTLLAYDQQRRRTLESMSLLASQTGEVIENVLQRDMLRSDFVGIQATFDAIGNDPRIRTLVLLDPLGRVIFAPEGRDVGRLLLNSHPTCQPCHHLPPEQRPSGIVVQTEDGQPVFRSMHPIENRPACSRCHDPERPLLGLLLTDFSIEPVESALALDLQRNLAWWIGTVVVTAVLAHFAIHRWVLRRLGSVVSAIEGVGATGQAARLPEAPADEIGRLSRAFNTMTDRLRARDRENRDLSQEVASRAEERGELLRQLISAQEDERRRLARELHDELGQELSSSALAIEVAQKTVGRDPQTTQGHLERAQRLLAEAADRMDDLILGLRPPALDDLGLEAALRSLAGRVLEPAGIAFQVEIGDRAGRLPPAVETAVFRIVQEGLTNVLRHAHAGRVVIRLRQEAGGLTAEVDDDGIGFDPDTQADRRRRLGLLGMRERAAQVGGEVEIRSTPGQGSTVTVRIPLDERSDD